MTAELVTGRTVLRYRGEPVTHDVRVYGDVRPAPGVLPDDDHPWRAHGVILECETCYCVYFLEPGHTDADLTRLARHHAGIEDEDP